MGVNAAVFGIFIRYFGSSVMIYAEHIFFVTYIDIGTDLMTNVKFVQIC
jgi:hypothetical protein